MDDENKKMKDISEAALEGAASENVFKYGSANKEFLVAYSGKDNEIGKTNTRGLKKISNYKLNSDPNYRTKNIKQQAGFAAEEIYTAKQNAENIINISKERISRTDDLKERRVNDPLHDHVKLDENGFEISGSGEQMKFVGNNPEQCLEALKSDKYQKYYDTDAIITVPSEYYNGIIEEANKQIEKLEGQLAEALEKGDTERALQHRKDINKLRKIKTSLKDSGITRQEAIYARLHPKMATAKYIVKISHRAGMQQAIIGIIVGGSISLTKNILAVMREEKTSDDAAKELLIDTGNSAISSYMISFTGSAIKGIMQNSKCDSVRILSQTNLPSTILNSTIDMGRILKDFITGKIDTPQCLERLGEKGVSQICSAMFATLGQLAIPIPIVGAMIGSMVGYSISTACYNETLNSLRDAKIVKEERIIIENECNEIIKIVNKHRLETERYINNYLKEYKDTFDKAFSQMDKAISDNDINSFIKGTNIIAKKLGRNSDFENKEQADQIIINKITFKL